MSYHDDHLSVPFRVGTDKVNLAIPPEFSPYCRQFLRSQTSLSSYGLRWGWARRTPITTPGSISLRSKRQLRERLSMAANPGQPNNTGREHELTLGYG